jgi:pentatricopeptide repeat protein
MTPLRIVNVRFLIWIVAALIVSAVGVHLLHGVQVKRHADALLYQAARAEESGDLEHAAKYYQTYLGYRRDDTDARIRWGDVLDHKENKSRRELQAVYSVFSEVLRHERNQHDIRRRLINISLKLEQYADAMGNLELLLNDEDYKKKERKATVGELEQQLAKCCWMKQDKYKAKQLCEAAIHDAPTHLLSYTQLAHYHVKDREYDKADKVLQQMVAANKENYAAHAEYARFLRGQKDKMRQARNELAEALRLGKDQADIILLAADFAVVDKKLDKAREHLLNGLKSHPDNVNFYRSLQNVEVEAKNYDRAEKILEEGIKAVPEGQKNDLRYYLALLLLQRNDLEGAEKQKTAMRDARTLDVILKEIDARSLIQKRQYSEAARILEAIKPNLNPVQTLVPGACDFLLGVCYEHLKKHDQALTAYRTAKEANPRMLGARIGEANALAALERTTDAIDKYREIVDTDPTVRVNLARMLIDRTAHLPENQQDWKQVEEVLNQAAKDNPDDTEVPVLRAQALLMQGKRAAAEATLEKARTEHADRMQLWLALIKLADGGGNRARVDQLLAEAKRRLGDRVELRVETARHLLPPGTKKLPAEVAALEDDTQKFGVDEPRLMQGLASAYQRAGLTTDAKRILEVLAAKSPEDLQVRLVLFDLALQTRDTDAQTDLLEDIRKIEGDKGTMWRYARASRLLASARSDADPKKKLRDARELLSQVAQDRPNWATVSLQLAQLNDLDGDHAKALENYTKAFDLGERDPAALKRAIGILLERRQYLEANKFLNEYENSGSTTEIDRYKSFLYYQSDKIEEAIAEASKPVKAGSQDPSDYAWLAHLQWRGKKPDDALATLGKAVRLPRAPQSPECWVAYVQLLFACDKAEQAEKVTEEAAKKLPPEVVAIAVAQCYEAIQKPQKAAAEYTAAVKKNPKDLSVLRNAASFHLRNGDAKGAEPYLRGIVHEETKAPLGDVAWARRGLALGLAASPDYRKTQEALSLLDENLKDNPDSSEDRRTKAMVLSYRPERRREAIALLEGIQGLTQTNEEKLLLAQLYDAVHETQKARGLFTSLAFQPNAKPDYVAFCAMSLIHNKDVDDALLVLKRLKTIAPDSIDTFKVEVSILKAHQKYAEAIDRVKKYSERKDANLLLAANQLEDLEDFKAAEALFRRMVSQKARPDALLLLADFLARRGQTDQALDLCEQAVKETPLQLPTVHAIAALEKAKKAPTSAQLQRVSGWLEEAIAKRPNDVLVLIQLAVLRTFEKDYKAAEDFYRKVIAQDERNYQALCNLACLVALIDRDVDEGLKLVTDAIKVGGELPELLDARALIEIKRGEAKPAIEDLVKATDVKSTPSMQYHLALAYNLANNRRFAVKHLRDAHRMGLSDATINPIEQEDHKRLVEVLGEQ